MNVALLGYGTEGKSSENYFSSHGDLVRVFDNFTPTELAKFDLSEFDLILRSPSVPPLDHHNFSSQTKYFFDHCPAPIIGVTGTKGKGTTCTLISAILNELKKSAPDTPDHPTTAGDRPVLSRDSQIHLVGNIGQPALDVLDQIQPTDLVVYELSSFQLWDLEKSPHIAVVLPIEPDHLNVHKDYTEYVNAKANITVHQTRADACVYFAPNPDSAAIATKSLGRQLPYPVEYAPAELAEVLDSLALIGPHNRDNAEAAILAVASLLNLTLSDFIVQYKDPLTIALSNCQGLPHRLEFIREVNQVKYYDDSFSTNAPSQQVALQSFPDQSIVLIAGGRDKTANQDLPEIVTNLTSTPNLAHVILIGESGHALAKMLPGSLKFTLCSDFPSAVTTASQIAESLPGAKSLPNAESLPNAVVLLSPAAASFDMFESAYDRGDQFQKLVNDLT